MFEPSTLSYEKDALEPHIDAATMEVHYEKHYKTYITKLNAALEKYPDLQGKTIEELLSDLASVPEDIRKPVQNNGGGYYNHDLFWQLLSPEGGEPSGDLASAIAQKFGSIDAFKQQFNDTAANLFGSNWLWLAWSKTEGLHLMPCSNQDNPVMQGHKPILGLDVWEHAYYLKYQNRRPEYIAAWWNVINWKRAEELFMTASISE